jgi:hypothetical protein
MSAAASNRGTRVVRRDIDARIPAVMVRADREAAKDEVSRLRERVCALERELARARRCVAELRRTKEERLAEARAEQARGDAAIRILTRLAFAKASAK